MQTKCMLNSSVKILKAGMLIVRQGSKFRLARFGDTQGKQSSPWSLRG